MKKKQLLLSVLFITSILIVNSCCSVSINSGNSYNIILKGILYEGEDIGDDFEVKFMCNGVEKTIKFKHSQDNNNGLKQFNQVILKNVRPIMDSDYLLLKIEGFEDDWLKNDYFRIQMQLQCASDGAGSAIANEEWHNSESIKILPKGFKEGAYFQYYIAVEEI